MTMNFLSCSKLCAWLACIFFVFHVHADTTLKIAIPKDVLQDYERFLHGRNPISIKDFSGEGSRRDVVEVIFMQQALRTGGVDAEITFVLTESYARLLAQIKNGNVIMAANSLWTRDLENMASYSYLSTPSINIGEFEAGFYTRIGNKKALNAQNLKDIQQLSAISNERWLADWCTLQKLKLYRVQSTIKWSSMVRMVARGRVDFLLAPFQANDELSLNAEGFTLIPIPNIKVGLNDSRAFGVSKNHPRGEEVYIAFNRGLNYLIERGVIRRAYEQSGFFNKRVAKWKKLN